MVIFGGGNEVDQISVVYTNGVKRIGTLPFQVDAGACHFNLGIVYLCYWSIGFADSISKRTCKKRYVI